MLLLCLCDSRGCEVGVNGRTCRVVLSDGASVLILLINAFRFRFRADVLRCSAETRYYWVQSQTRDWSHLTGLKTALPGSHTVNSALAARIRPSSHPQQQRTVQSSYSQYQAHSTRPRFSKMPRLSVA